jgi:hypothetical protein
MAGLRPGHPRLSYLWVAKTWMPGTRPGMTSFTMSSDSVSFLKKAPQPLDIQHGAGRKPLANALSL